MKGRGGKAFSDSVRLVRLEGGIIDASCRCHDDDKAGLLIATDFVQFSVESLNIIYIICAFYISRLYIQYYTGHMVIILYLVEKIKFKYEISDASSLPT